MKWHDLYLGLQFADEKMVVTDLFTQLLNSEPFPCKLHIGFENDGQPDEKVLYADRVVNFHIDRIQRDHSRMSKTLEIRVAIWREDHPQGLPDGMRSGGQHVLKIDHGGLHLPPDMFLDGDVPAELAERCGGGAPRCPTCKRKAKAIGEQYEGQEIYQCPKCVSICRYDDDCTWKSIFTVGDVEGRAQGHRLSVCDNASDHC